MSVSGMRVSNKCELGARMWADKLNNDSWIIAVGNGKRGERGEEGQECECRRAQPRCFHVSNESHTTADMLHAVHDAHIQRRWRDTRTATHVHDQAPALTRIMMTLPGFRSVM